MSSRESDNFRNDRGDYRYSDEAKQRDLMIIWKCSNCGRERRDYPGHNEGGRCYCGGHYQENGESYSM